MNEITINGETYIKKSDASEYLDRNHVCIIADRGWIFEGYLVEPDSFKLVNAHVVRRWDNGLGIGGLAKAEHKDDYTLDHIGSIEIRPHAAIAVIPLEW